MEQYLKEDIEHIQNEISQRTRNLNPTSNHSPLKEKKKGGSWGLREEVDGGEPETCWFRCKKSTLIASPRAVRMKLIRTTRGLVNTETADSLQSFPFSQSGKLGISDSLPVRLMLLAQGLALGEPVALSRHCTLEPCCGLQEHSSCPPDQLHQRSWGWDQGMSVFTTGTR